MCISLMQVQARRAFRKWSFKMKKFLNPPNRSGDGEDANLTESDREKEKQDILGRIKLLQSYECAIRKRNL